MRISDGPHVAEGLSALGVQFGLSRTVRDSAALLDAVHGRAVGEPYDIPPPARPYLGEVARDAGRLPIGVVSANWASVRVDEAIARALQDTAALLSDFGHDVEQGRLDIGVSWDRFVAARHLS